MTGHKIKTVTKRRCENNYYKSIFLFAMCSCDEVLGDKSYQYIGQPYTEGM